MDENILLMSYFINSMFGKLFDHWTIIISIVWLKVFKYYFCVESEKYNLIIWLIKLLHYDNKILIYLLI